MAVISVLLPDCGHSTSHTVPPHTVPPCFSTMRDYTPNWDPESALLPQLTCVRYLTTAMRRTGTTSGHSQCPSSPQALKVSDTSPWLCPRLHMYRVPAFLDIHVWGSMGGCLCLGEDGARCGIPCRCCRSRNTCTVAYRVTVRCGEHR